MDEWMKAFRRELCCWFAAGTLFGVVLVVVACTAPSRVVTTDAGPVPFQVPACTAANLRQRLHVAGGSWLWCVPVEGSDKPEWVETR